MIGSGILQGAAAHIRALQVRTAHHETRNSCQLLLGALASLELLPAGQSAASLTFELQRDQTTIRDSSTAPREVEILRLRQQLLRYRLLRISFGSESQIPRVVHLIKTDPRTDDLPLLQSLCYRSIIARCCGYRVILHAPQVPRGPRWEALLPHLELDIGMPPQRLGNERILGAAHQSDVWRLQHLITYGGFYFDWDLLLLRSPERLRSQVCVMGLERLEQGYREVLGVAAIGAEPGSLFLAAWLDAMPAVFDPNHYVAHSTLLAHRLALKWPAMVRVLNYRSFYDPGWGDKAMRWLFDPTECLPDDQLQERVAGSTGIHLFSSHANFVRWASRLTEKDIELPRCNLAKLMRPYL